MKFEWDENKNQANIAKHEIDFNEAKTVFLLVILSVQSVEILQSKLSFELKPGAFLENISIRI